MSSEALSLPQPPPDAQPQGVPAAEGGHEQNTIRLSTTVWLTIMSLAIVAMVQVGLWGGLKWADTERKNDVSTALYPGRERMQPDQFPAPRLEVRYDEEIAQVRAEEEALISHYGWADRKAGVARIPVERAMEILAERGLPKVAAPEPTAGAPPNTFVPIAGKREMAAPAVSTGESPAKAGAPPAVLPPGKTPTGAEPKPGEPAKAGSATPPSPSSPAEDTNKGAVKKESTKKEDTKKEARP